MASRPSQPPRPLRPSRSGGPRTRGARPGARPVAGSSRGAGRSASAGTRTPGGAGRGRAGAAVPARPRFTGRAAILVLVLAVLAVSYASSLRAYLEQRDHVSALHADIAESQATIESLELEKDRWEDPAFVRTQARLRFGWVLPGEIGFQVIDEDGQPLDHDESLDQPAVEADSRPTWWRSAWRSVQVAGRPDGTQQPGPARRILAPRTPHR